VKRMRRRTTPTGNFNLGRAVVPSEFFPAVPGHKGKEKVHAVIVDSHEESLEHQIDPLIIEAVDLLIATDNVNELEKVLRAAQDATLKLYILSRLLQETAFKPNGFVGPMLGAIILDIEKKNSAVNQSKRKEKEEWQLQGDQDKEKGADKPSIPRIDDGLRLSEQDLPPGPTENIKSDPGDTETADEIIDWMKNKDSFYGDEI